MVYSYGLYDALSVLHSVHELHELPDLVDQGEGAKRPHRLLPHHDSIRVHFAVHDSHYDRRRHLVHCRLLCALYLNVSLVHVDT